MDGYTIVLTRNNISESYHEVDIVNDTSSESFDFFPRSAIKPFQLIPIVQEMLNQKTEIDLSEIAIFCASHSGEALHTEKVLKTAEKYLLNYEDIFCEKQIPFHAETYKSMIKENKPYTKLHNNCSGKHIGMLLFCKLLDLEIENYQETTHPIQQKIDLFYRELFNLEKITYGIDGCGLPAPYINSNIFLSSVSKLNNSKIYEESWKIIFNAFYSHPVHTAGSDRVDTILMQNSPNDVLIKAGAEGSMFFTDLKKSTLLKCKDGSKRGVDIASMYFGLKSSYIDETTYNNFIKSFTHNNQNTKVADVKILEK
jgi:L-asparaginase II